jgi:nucleotide-binding universal stress UspA family protein
MKPIKRILVATDFSECSERALDHAIALARAFGASITLLHAWEIPVYGFPDGSFIASPEASNRIMNAARDALTLTVDRRKDSGVRIEPELREDVAWMAIGAVAEEIDADLVVLGTHGRRGLSHALLGSVAEKVIRTCSRPVLTIRGPAAGAREARAETSAP